LRSSASAWLWPALIVFDEAIDWAFSSPTPGAQLAAVVSLLGEAGVPSEAVLERLATIEQRGASTPPLKETRNAHLSVPLVYVRVRRFNRARDLLKSLTEVDASQDLVGEGTNACIRAATLALDTDSDLDRPS